MNQPIVFSEPILKGHTKLYSSQEYISILESKRGGYLLLMHPEEYK